ncbi:transglycosylase SLT domain-containing protein [Thalassotalea marina]|uniref:Lytic transglycosylase n=1 Tax=Thalassotalea marina TaxID=1673741 RepID=A0A919BHC2_9GAMM|nr:transglycosylase SLT domain-containing protein [Thalassotalea marina]GHF90247.1 lytic transglycosylase [Thalassotalea marina]
MFRLFLIVALFVSLSNDSVARESSTQRDLFLKAEKQLWKHRSSAYQELYQQLHFYPLQPYLDQKRLMHKMRLSSAKEIATFLEKYKGTPLDWPLRKKWLQYLAKRNRQTLFLEFFSPTSDVELNCRHYLYQLNKGEPANKVLKQVASLWVVGKSQPKACDPLFNKWQEAGLRTEQHVWQRLSKAADGGNHTLIPYITSLLPEKEQYLGQLWHKVRRDPAAVTVLSRFKTKSAKESEIFVYGIKRLIWRAPDNALATYKKAETVFTLSDQQKQSIALRFALALASKKHEAAKDWLAKVNDENLTNKLVQWIIADALREQNWPKVKQSLLALPRSKQNSNQWQYWYGRSLLETGEQEKGRQQLQSLAGKRHYYGFLSASLLNIPVNYQHKPITVTEEEKANLFKDSAGKRAFELFHLGRFHAARKEWNYWFNRLDQRQKLVAAKLANGIGWYDRPIFALSQVGYLDDIDMRFPLAFSEQITEYSNKHAIDPAWAFAIARRESSFMLDAHSAVGAKGLMQVMPSTAKHLTKRKRVSTKYLIDSDNNINLGTRYLRDLLKRHKGNQILATAAYNAGPYRVKAWLNKIDSLPADIWIETIPFQETRDYVKSVLAYQQIYRHKVGEQSTLFNELHQMNITPL